MAKVAPFTAQRCGRALLMPNTLPAIRTAEDVNRYRQEAKAVLGDCEPVMTIKLTPDTTPQIIREAWTAGARAAKLYPEGETTNAEDGIPATWLLVHRLGGQLQLRFPEMKRFPDVLATMQDLGMVLCMHGEMPGEDTFTSPYDMMRAGRIVLPGQTDKIGVFLQWVEWALLNFPRLKMVLEHITTKTEVERIQQWASGGRQIAATITVHHTVIRHEDIIRGKLKPHLFCKPIAKFEDDRQALQLAMMNGEPWFFLGTDNAPHPLLAKEAEECCAGVWFPHWLEYLTWLFDHYGKLERLADFTSRFGDQFYGLPSRDGEIRLVREEWMLPKEAGGIKQFMGGQKLQWRLT